jgi:hypothetical protein
MLAVAAMTKFAPFVLVPLFLAGRRGLGAGGVREPALAVAGLLAAVALLLLHPLVDPGLGVFWDRTLGSQAARESPFSVWGQIDADGLHTLVKLAVAAGAAALAFVPRQRSFRQIVALAAALMIAAQLLAEHWFYLYIVWFLPLLLVALALDEERSREGSDLAGGDEQLLDRARQPV